MATSDSTDKTVSAAEQVNREEFNKLKSMYEGKSQGECFALMHLAHKQDIESVRKEMSAVKEKVDDLETFVQNLDQSVTDINEKSLVDIREDMSEESHRRLELEQWGRKWNLIVRGIEGVTSEKPRETEAKFRNFLKLHLKMSEGHVKEILLQAIHRLPGGNESKRNIIVRFVSLIDRDEVLSSARSLPKGSGYSISPDLNPEAGKLRAHLLSKLRAMPFRERKQHRLIYTREYPFVALKEK